MKTSKITTFDAKKPFQGTTSAFVTFEDESWGFFEYKGDAPFAVGDEVDYDAKPEKTKGGKNIFKLTIAKKAQSVSETPQKEVKEETKLPKGNLITNIAEDAIVKMKYDTKVPIMQICNQGFLGGKIERKEFREWFEELTTMMDASIDDLKG